jgi:hypothetical protein
VDPTQIVLSLAGIGLASGLVILVGVLVYRGVERWRPTSLTGKNIALTIENFAKSGIWYAENTAADLLATVGTKLAGADKKKIADSTYALWPETVWIAGRSWPIGDLKTLVPPAQWEVDVQAAFDKMSAAEQAARAFLLSQVGLKPVTVLTPPPTVHGANVPQADGYLPGPPGAA